jgi:hypothetical protein
VLGSNLTPCCRVSLPYIVVFFYIKVIHQIFQTTCSHTPHCQHCNYCHYSNGGIELFHNITCYTNFIYLLRIHVHTTKLSNFAFTLVAISVILQSLQCTYLASSTSPFDLVICMICSANWHGHGVNKNKLDCTTYEYTTKFQRC